MNLIDQSVEFSGRPKSTSVGHPFRVQQSSLKIDAVTIWKGPANARSPRTGEHERTSANLHADPRDEHDLQPANDCWAMRREMGLCFIHGWFPA
jgi:hypothetical protein